MLVLQESLSRPDLLPAWLPTPHRRRFSDAVAAIDRIVQQVLSLGEREIPSRQIGEMVMQELHKLDKVGYIRFASVYRSFQDISDFRDALPCR